MSNGEWCCVLGICCPENSGAQETAFVNEFAHDMSASKDQQGYDRETVALVGRWVLSSFDLAPKGSLVEFKQAIKTHVEKKLKG